MEVGLIVTTSVCSPASIISYFMAQLHARIHFFSYGMSDLMN